MIDFPTCIRTPKGFDITVTANVSTGHVTANDNEILSNVLTSIPHLYARHEYGWEFTLCGFVEAESRAATVKELESVGLSEALINLLSSFADLGYRHLNLDRDAEPVEGLPTFEW